jgi:spermine oxidase
LSLSILILSGENVVDLGAQWVHGQSGNLVYELASKHDLLNSSAILVDPSQHEFITINGEIRPKEEGGEVMRIFFEIIDKIKQVEFQEENESLGDYFVRE